MKTALFLLIALGLAGCGHIHIKRTVIADQIPIERVG